MKLLSLNICLIMYQSAVRETPIVALNQNIREKLGIF